MTACAMKRAWPAHRWGAELGRAGLLDNAVQDRMWIDMVERAKPADDALGLFPMRQCAQTALLQRGNHLDGG